VALRERVFVFFTMKADWTISSSRVSDRMGG
jgi:hypothetical protein